MKLIYKLPKYLAVIVCIGITAVISQYVKRANATDFFDMVQNSDPIEPVNTILGMDAYMLLMMIGLFFAIVLAIARRDLVKIKAWTAAVIAVLFFLQAYFGAKVLAGLEHVIDSGSFAAFTMNGQSLYGTVPMTLIFVPVLALIIKRDTKQLLDYFTPLWLTLLVFVRLGCFTVGCCGADPCVIAGVEMVIPVQLIEVALDLVILQIIFNMEKKSSGDAGDHSREGHLFFVMLIMYGAYRFFLEFVRNTEVVFMGATYAQIYSVVCIIAAIIVLRKLKK